MSWRGAARCFLFTLTEHHQTLQSHVSKSAIFPKNVRRFCQHCLHLHWGKCQNDISNSFQIIIWAERACPHHCHAVAFRAFRPDLTPADVRRTPFLNIPRVPVTGAAWWATRSLRQAGDPWAQTSSCEMSHPSVLNITVNTNDSLFAICPPSGSSLKGPQRLLCIRANMRRQKRLNFNRAGGEQRSVWPAHFALLCFSCTCADGGMHMGRCTAQAFSVSQTPFPFVNHSLLTNQLVCEACSWQQKRFYKLIESPFPNPVF